MAPSCYLSAKSPSRFHDVCPHCGYSRSPTGGGVFCVSADVTLVVTPCLVAPGRDELTDHLLGLLFTSTFSGFTKAALVSAHSCSPLSAAPSHGRFILCLSIRQLLHTWVSVGCWGYCDMVYSSCVDMRFHFSRFATAGVAAPVLVF